ncbi:hypothetical protein T03_9372 [Trichinella britovi]|uniref:Uncharacterized protein n=1 Tax=Trichinella britovi TaxID=45882 RepID=A0A0V1CZW1_TRIBR|nr:hypothetical protein T03_9372 [Trichinella britovi]
MNSQGGHRRVILLHVYSRIIWSTVSIPCFLGGCDLISSVTSFLNIGEKSRSRKIRWGTKWTPTTKPL